MNEFFTFEFLLSSEWLIPIIQTASNLAIMIAFFTLYGLLQNAREANKLHGYKWLCAFILMCGASHGFDILPFDYFDVLLDMITAATSIAMIFILVKCMKKNDSKYLARLMHETIRAQEFIDKMPFPAFACGPAGGYLAVNKHFIDLLGEEISSTTGYRWYKRISGKSAQGYSSKWLAFCKGERNTFSEECIWEHPDGRMLNIKTTGYPWKHGWWGRIQDMTVINEAQSFLEEVQLARKDNS